MSRRLPLVARTAATAGAVAALVLAPVAAAQEAPPPPGPMLLLDILARPGVEGREAAYDEAIRQAPPPPRPRAGVVQPDGSVRYGDVSVYVKDCPEAAPLVPPPLPGRRARY
jgi:hypothetical protein